MWGLVVLAIILLWVAYEMDKGRKARGEPRIPVLGFLFDSVSFNFREEIDGESIVESKADGKSTEAVAASSKKKHKHHHKHKKHNASRSSAKH